MCAASINIPSSLSLLRRSLMEFARHQNTENMDCLTHLCCRWGYHHWMTKYWSKMCTHPSLHSSVTTTLQPQFPPQPPSNHDLIFPKLSSITPIWGSVIHIYNIYVYIYIYMCVCVCVCVLCTFLVSWNISVLPFSIDQKIYHTDINI